MDKIKKKYTIYMRDQVDGKTRISYITFFKIYEKMKKWLDDWQGEGFYNYLVELYEKQLNKGEK